jgi:SpoIIAA-like
MPITMERERHDTCVMTCRGMVRKQELDLAQRQLLGGLGPADTVRLLVVLDGFEGLESTGAWSDLTFYVRHGDRIERIAIVGPERWRSESLMFAGADLRKAPVEFFVESAIADARQWLSA